MGTLPTSPATFLHLVIVSSTNPPVVMPLFSLSNHDWERGKKAIPHLLGSPSSIGSLSTRHWLDNTTETKQGTMR